MLQNKGEFFNSPFFLFFLKSITNLTCEMNLHIHNTKSNTYRNHNNKK